MTDHAPPAKGILVVEDQRAFAQSIQVVLEAQDEVGWVEAVSDGESSIDVARERRPDVVVMDFELPGMNGIEATRRLLDHDPGITVVVLTGIPDAAVFARAAAAGAHAFLLKDSSLDEILEAVLHTSPRSRIEVDPSSVEEIVKAGDHDASEVVTQITPRELEVLGLLSEGRQPKEIARSMGISVNTCRGYVKSLLAKLDAHSALEAVVTANRLGVISLPPH